MNASTVVSAFSDINAINKDGENVYEAAKAGLKNHEDNVLYIFMQDKYEQIIDYINTYKTKQHKCIKTNTLLNNNECYLKDINKIEPSLILSIGYM